MDETEDKKYTRVLYVPPKIISWEAMVEHGVKLIKQGYSVQMHEHSADGTCSPNGVATRCGRLTLDGEAARLEPVSEGSKQN